MTEELKPCPFCGGKPFTNHRHGGIMGQVYCKNDECFGPRTTALCIEDSARQWNKRPVVVPAQRSAGYELAEEDYKRARDCMASILQEYKKKGCNPLLDSNFDNAFQHAVGIMSLSVRHAEATPDSEDDRDTIEVVIACCNGQMGRDAAIEVISELRLAGFEIVSASRSPAATDAELMAGVANLGVKEVADCWEMLEHHGFPPEAMGWPHVSLGGRLPHAINNAISCLVEQREELLRQRSQPEITNKPEPRG